MRRLTTRDAVATLAVVAVLVPYTGYLIRGEMPFVQDPRGMAAVGIAGLLVAAAAWGLRLGTRFGTMMTVALVATFALGVAAVWVGLEGSAVLLGLFIGAMVVVWLAETLFDAGRLHLTA